MNAGSQIRQGSGEAWGPVSHEISAKAGEFLRWEVDGLEAATHYEYRVQMTTDAGEEWPIVRGDFTTQRLEPGQPAEAGTDCDSDGADQDRGADVARPAQRWPRWKGSTSTRSPPRG